MISPPSQPKLLLRWRDKTVMEHVLAAFDLPQIRARVVVCRREDEDLQRVAGEAGADVICRYEDPPDMKTSVTSAASYIQGEYDPRSIDGWLLSPADYVRLNVETVAGIVDHWNQLTSETTDPLVLLPTYECKSMSSVPA